MRNTIRILDLSRPKAWLLACLAVGPAAAGAVRLAARPARLAVGAAKPAELPGLRNVFHVSRELYCGAAPEGDAGFATLWALGAAP